MSKETSVFPSTAEELLDRYQGFLLDAYGVLVDASGALPQAQAFLTRLAATGKPWVLLTNDASRTPASVAGRLTRLGLPVSEAQVVTPSSLLAPYYRQHGLAGAGTVVLGTPDTVHMAEAAGARVILATEAEPAEVQVVIAGDEGGYHFLEVVDATLSLVLSKLDRGEPLHLLLPNPDLIYPKRPGQYGLAAGSVALLIEAAARLRHGDGAAAFQRLGKPHAPIFEEALRRLGTRQALMIGDQLETDVRGARGVGIDAAWLTSGVTRRAPGAGEAPTHVLAALLGAPSAPR